MVGVPLKALSPLEQDIEYGGAVPVIWQPSGIILDPEAEHITMALVEEGIDPELHVVMLRL